MLTAGDGSGEAVGYDGGLGLREGDLLGALAGGDSGDGDGHLGILLGEPLSLSLMPTIAPPLKSASIFQTWI